jgi:hypothetical protein
MYQPPASGLIPVCLDPVNQPSGVRSAASAARGSAAGDSAAGDDGW